VQSRGFELEGKASLNDNTAAYAYLDNRISKSNNTVRYAPINDIGVDPAINAEGITTYAVPRHTASARPTSGDGTPIRQFNGPFVTKFSPESLLFSGG